MKPSNLFVLASLWVCVSAALPAQDTPKGGLHAIDVQGEDSSRARAIAAGLHAAVLQVLGGRIEGSEQTKSELEQIVSNTGTDVKDVLRATQDIRQTTKGFVRGYEVLSAEAGADGIWVARLRVRVLRFDPENPRGGERPALLLQDFEVREGAPVKTRALPLERVKGELRDRVTAHAEQSGVFVTVSRDQQRQLEKEHEFALSDAAGPLEGARVGMMLGADFLLRGTIHEFVVEDRISNVGGVDIVTEHASARIGIEVVNVATGTAVTIPDVSVGWRSLDLDRNRALNERRRRSPSGEHLLMELAVEQTGEQIARRFAAAPWLQTAKPVPSAEPSNGGGMTPFERALLERLDAIERRMEAMERELVKRREAGR